MRQERIRQSVIGDPETIDCPVREQTREQPFKDLCHVSSVMKQRYSRQWALGHRLLSMRQPQKSGPTENHILMAIISPHPPPSCSQPQELVFISPTQPSSKPPLQASERTTNQPLLQYVVILGLSHIGETAAPFTSYNASISPLNSTLSNQSPAQVTRHAKHLQLPGRPPSSKTSTSQRTAGTSELPHSSYSRFVSRT